MGSYAPCAASASAERPEEVCVLACVGGYDFPVGFDDRELQHVCGALGCKDVIGGYVLSTPIPCKKPTGLCPPPWTHPPAAPTLFAEPPTMITPWASADSYTPSHR